VCAQEVRDPGVTLLLCGWTEGRVCGRGGMGSVVRAGGARWQGACRLGMQGMQVACRACRWHAGHAGGMQGMQVGMQGRQVACRACRWGCRWHAGGMQVACMPASWPLPLPMQAAPAPAPAPPGPCRLPHLFRDDRASRAPATRPPHVVQRLARHFPILSPFISCPSPLFAIVSTTVGESRQPLHLQWGEGSSGVAQLTLTLANQSLP
jgi:hypothetical protein